jgi:hypothetical protein
MQQDNQHINKKLQELESQSLPDLSKMDDHWQQMKTMIQPGVVPAGKKNNPAKRYFRWMIAAVFTGALFLMTYQFVLRPKRSKTISGKANEQPAIDKKIKTDILPSLSVRDKDESEPQEPRLPPAVKSLKVRTTSGVDTILRVVPVNDPVNPSDEMATLDKFFKQLEKPVQEFVIDNQKDTVITGEDGTALLIPAYTFSGKGSVIISMREFYSYEDIITNKLSTCSDGRQLVTSGMIHLFATVDGKQVDIQPGRSIQWFVPDTTAAMKRMQLFTGNVATRSKNTLTVLNDFFEGTRDTVAVPGNFEGINWIPQQRYFSDGVINTVVRVLDLRNEPFKTRNTKHGLVGVFHISADPKANKEYLQTMLKDKYGYYKVKVKKRRDGLFTRLFPHFLERGNRTAGEDVGDSAWVSLKIATTYNLQATDTISSTPRRTNSEFYPVKSNLKEAIINKSLNDLAKRFSVDIRNLGWINCDRFYNDQRPRVDYYVDLKDTAVNYYTLLVFENMRSMLSGYTNGNKIVFSNVPEGEPAKVISVGIQNGKTVAAMENVLVSKTPFSNLKFERTSPADFKEDVKVLDE